MQSNRDAVQDLQRSVETYWKFEGYRRRTFSDAASLIARVPSLQAMMTTHDPETIQDASETLSRLSNSGVFLLSDQADELLAIHSRSGDVTAASAKSCVSKTSSTGSHNWCFAADHLFELFTQPIYLGSPTEGRLLGFVRIGYAIDGRIARDIASVAGGQAAFRKGKKIVASTLPNSELAYLTEASLPVTDTPRQISLANEQFLSIAISLEPDGAEPIQLIVLKSMDEAQRFLHGVNLSLMGLGVFAICTGSVLVFLISRSFTRPLEVLGFGFQALEAGDFRYPLRASGTDELSSLIQSFCRMRSNLLEAQNKLLETDRLATIGTMASSISHDLRHQLTPILSNAEFMTDGALNNAEREELYLEIRTAVTDMTELLESLLELSRSQTLLRLELVSVNDVARHAIQAISMHPASRDVSFQVHSTSNIEASVDPARLRRALYNLLMNSCESGSTEVRIDVINHFDQLQILISDNGSGVASEVRDSLFQPFISHGKQNGTGLGLAIVQKICQDHRGLVALEKISPMATTFSIKLPLLIPAARETDPYLNTQIRS